MADQLHGSFTPPGRFSAGCPHWLRRFYHARTVTEQEYHCPYCLSSPYREPSDTDSRLLFAPCRKRKPKTLKTNTGEISLLHFPQIVAQPLMWLMLITIAIGMCLMNGYLIVKERQEVNRKAPSLYLPFSEGLAHLYSKSFFNFSRIRIFFL